MDSLISLPFDLQMILVAGFIAYKVSVIGRGAAHTTEDFLLQVVSFGTFARGLAMFVEFASSFAPTRTHIIASLPGGRTFALGLLTVILGLIVGMLWRRWLCAFVSKAMRGLKVYRDDHEHSAWATLTNGQASWTVVQLHLADGRILEAEFKGDEEKTLPMRPVSLNADGVALFVTGIYQKDGTFRPADRDPATYGYVLTFVPRDQIKQVDVSLKA